MHVTLFRLIVFDYYKSAAAAINRLSDGQDSGATATEELRNAHHTRPTV